MSLTWLDIRNNGFTLAGVMDIAEGVKSNLTLLHVAIREPIVFCGLTLPYDSVPVIELNNTIQEHLEENTRIKKVEVHIYAPNNIRL
jgi:hypothetical protein